MQAEMLKLRQTLASLDEMVKMGLPVEAAQTQARERLAHLEGRLAAAQEAGRAVGPGGVLVEGDVHGDVVGGRKVTTFDQRGQTVGRQVNVAGNVYQGAPSQDPAEALAIYRRVLAAACAHLPLRGVDVGAADAAAGQRPLGLASVYVALDTTARVPQEPEEKKRRDRAPLEGRETRPLGALEAAAANRRLVLLGDPGGGKTTFVHHLAHCLAAHAAQPEAGWLEHLPGWPPAEAGALPVLLILRDLARWLPDPLPQRAEPHHLWDFIAARLEAQRLGFVAGPLGQALDKGQALLLLDGLDEVPTAAQRAFVRDAVAAFAGRYPDNRMLATCRVLSYQLPSRPDTPDLRLPGFPAFELAPFDEARIDRFVGAWYGELAQQGTVRPEDAAGMAGQLRRAVRRPDLWRLAPNPLLLTVMALVHTHKGRLPEARALLYEETVDILLWRWEQIKAGGREEAPRLRQLLLEAGRGDVDLKRALWQLAYEAHAQVGGEEGEGLADIGELRLEKALAALKDDDRTWAQQVVATIKLRAGLLLERAPEVYTFPHRTFQEYLAGAHLATQVDLARQGARLAGEGAGWREVILLAVGRLVHLAGDLDKPLALVGELCPAQVEESETGWRRAWLAGDALLEMGPRRAEESALGRELLARVRGRLAGLVGGGWLAPRERAAAGRTLARLGDPRPEVTRPEATAFCYVPAGRFWMGSGKKEEGSKPGEKPRHRVEIPYDYWMARYPVTAAQYRAFVADGGYRQPGYWPEAAAAGLWREGRVRVRQVDWERSEVIQVEADRPQELGEPYEMDNHPVVGVCWYEALAYTRWLSARLRGVALQRLADAANPAERVLWEGMAAGQWAVRLPSEAEWEKAARGIEGQVYPWSGKWDETRCNSGELGLGSTTPVGIFPQGASPYGCLDMAGNVWEWTRSLWAEDWQKPAFKYPYDPAGGRESPEAPDRVLRVVRGGSFGYNRNYARCAVRNRFDPGGRFYVIGFRVVVSPISPPSAL